MRSSFAGGCLVMILAASVACATVQSQSDPSAAETKALQEFKGAVQRYIEIHNKAEAAVAPLKKTDDPAEISGRERALALAIQTLRKGARQGEIFTPAVEPYIRRIIKEDMRRRGRAEVLGLLKDQTPTNVELKVNDIYPTTQPLKIMPPLLLQKLPLLPEEIEYRFVGRHLIIRDVHANLIVDYLLNVIPERT